MKPPIMTIDGYPSQTVRIASADAAANFANAYFTQNGRSVIAALITVEDNNIRYAFGGVDPTNAGDEVGHILYVGQALVIKNSYALRTFSYINEAAGNNSVLQVTFYFGVQV